MKKIFLFFAIALSVATKAQVTNVSLRASGLTCSMCSNAINKALKTLDFIEDVTADIKTYTFDITFKANCTVDFDKIKMKVEEAGFSVSGFVATIHFNNVQVKGNQAITIENKTFVFVNVKDQALQGAREIKILDRGFISPKEYKSYAFSASSPGTYHATI